MASDLKGLNAAINSAMGGTANRAPARRALPGKIIREAPPGREMTKEQFELAMEDFTNDAARWRWLMRNLQLVLDWPVELMTAAHFRQRVDENMAQDR